MKSQLLISFILIGSLFISGCGSVDEQSESEYRKVSFYADVSLSHTVEVMEEGRGLLVCLGQGTIGSVMYFDKDGGEYLSQESTLTLNEITCQNFGTTKPCTAEPVLTDGELISVPVILNAELFVDGSRMESGGITKFEDQLIYSIEEFPLYPIDITYYCDGAPGTFSDYGVTLSQLTLPFTHSTWDAAFQPNGVEVHTLKNYDSFGNMATIEFGILEEFVDEIK